MKYNIPSVIIIAEYNGQLLFLSGYVSSNKATPIEFNDYLIDFFPFFFPFIRDTGPRRVVNQYILILHEIKRI